MTIRTGINGFGRFGLHLLKYYLDRAPESRFRIDYINDDTLTLEQSLKIIQNDAYVRIPALYKISVEGDQVTFTSAAGVSTTLTYTRAPKEKIPWLGEPDLFLECSGKNSLAKSCHPFLTGRTRLVVISATSWDAEKTVVYGFNHKEPLKKARVISYGSCTVNAFVPLGDFVHRTWGIVDSDVNVIHNIQEYRLKDPKTHTLLRKFCTLEKSGPNLLPFLNEHNFIVNYTVVPYAGVSIIDFRFRLANPPASVEQAMRTLEESFVEGGGLAHLYGMDETDRGPEVHVCTPHSTVFVRDKARLLGNNLYLQGYFDNENSVNRYYDLVNYLAGQG